MSMTVARLTALALLFFLLISTTQADCGCGSRCQKYTNKLQCGRCCTATVRRSVPFEMPSDISDIDDANDVKNDEKISIELQSTRRRSLAELSSILSLLEQKERRASSKKVRTELRRTRQRLERYGQVRYGDLIDQEATDDQRQFKAEEKEMYDVLERIIQRLVQKHQVDVDTTTTVDKRSAETPARRTTEERLMKLFRL
ncbi:hypothetical protein M3Y97_00414100 [Aphelenchoides bicaudatus]|nr:hypothetical protein M3Y97_00414100 [Aphelenchoides bicaudatus]